MSEGRGAGGRATIGTAALALALAAALGAAGCAASGAGTKARRHAAPLAAPAADSITSGLWRFDESAGNSAPDSGPFRLTGTVGLDARTEFGRFRSARRFTRSADSFVFVPYNPEMESSRGFTIEAWIDVSAYGPYELTPIAGRWSQYGDDQSWLFAVVGQRTPAAFSSLPSPGWFQSQVSALPTGALVLLVQPAQAAGVQVFASSVQIPLDTWAHVAATWDGELVRFYVDGQMDAQFVLKGSIRSTTAPLLIGNYFDTQRLTEFRGPLELDQTADRNPYYAFSGLIDEVRLSSLARTSFDSAPYR